MKLSLPCWRESHMNAIHFTFDGKLKSDPHKYCQTDMEFMMEKEFWGIRPPLAKGIVASSHVRFRLFKTGIFIIWFHVNWFCDTAMTTTTLVYRLQEFRCGICIQYEVGKNMAGHLNFAISIKICDISICGQSKCAICKCKWLIFIPCTHTFAHD